MKKIAITGNISSGKTVFLDYLKENGFKTLSLDDTTSNIYTREDFIKFLKNEFNTTDKKEISKMVFDNPVMLKKLENFIYPLIKYEMDSFFDKNKTEKLVFVEAPVLFEAGFEKYFNKIIFIAAPLKTRLERLISRNNCTETEAVKRMKAQLNEEIKIKKSDIIIKNTGTKEEFLKKADAVKEELMLL